MKLSRLQTCLAIVGKLTVHVQVQKKNPFILVLLVPRGQTGPSFPVGYSWKTLSLNVTHRLIQQPTMIHASGILVDATEAAIASVIAQRLRHTSENATTKTFIFVGGQPDRVVSSKKVKRHGTFFVHQLFSWS